MGHLHTSLVLFLLFFSLRPSNGTTFLTHLGTQCIEDCKINWSGEYKCKTFDTGRKWQEMYCSPQANMDYWGRQCRADSKCGKHGQDYYWCKTDTFHWRYCGLVMDENYYGSYYGSMCYDHCDQRKEDYYYCHTADGWDYCSPSENTDYKNKQCKEDSPCGKQGQNYNWCKLKEGSWGYCGLVELKMLLHRSKYHYVCTDECQYYESGGYYWCHTANSWDYCSPEVDVTYKGKPCRSDHSCGLHDKSYNWCWTSKTDYDYCGPIESGECTYITSRHRNKRAPGNKILICTKVDKGTKTKTTFHAEPAPKDIADGSQWRTEVQNLISRWDNGYLVEQARSNLIHSDNLRIDMQGIINHNNQRYYNLQIQMNVRRVPGQSTTVSQIIVPEETPRRYIRRAFVESFQRRARVFIFISSVNQS